MFMALTVRLELTTTRLTAAGSTDWAKWAYWWGRTGFEPAKHNAPDLQSTNEVSVTAASSLDENYVTASLVQAPLATWLLPHINIDINCSFHPGGTRTLVFFHMLYSMLKHITRRINLCATRLREQLIIGAGYMTRTCDTGGPIATK